MKKYFSFVLVLVLMLTTTTVAYANDSIATYDENYGIALPVAENQVTSVDIQVSENYVVTLRVAQANGMVYADAHGNYSNTSNGNSVSSYGMYVSFTVTNNKIAIASGDQFTAYHNASTSGYTANYEKSISGESTSTCTAKTKYTLTNSPDAEITIKLVIDSQGSPTVYFNGNYSQHNSIFSLK